MELWQWGGGGTGNAGMFGQSRQQHNRIQSLEIVYYKLGLMNELHILRNRTLNSIEHIKHALKGEEFMILYNDLLILQQIVPRLCKQTLRELLAEIRKIQRSLERSAQGQFKEGVSITRVVDLLAEAGDEDPLLEVFLQCSVHEDTMVVAGR